MKRLMISGFAAIALLAATTIIVLSHSHSSDRAVAAADMSQESKTATGVNLLPVEDYEDMSLVFSKPAK